MSKPTEQQVAIGCLIIIAVLLSACLASAFGFISWNWLHIGLMAVAMVFSFLVACLAVFVFGLFALAGLSILVQVARGREGFDGLKNTKEPNHD